MRTLPFLLLLAATGCFGTDKPDDSVPPEGDTDTDADSDTDSDSDSDSDTDSDTDPVGPGFEAGLTYDGGCADVVLYAWRPDDTLALFFRTTGVAEAAHAAGEATTFSWTLPDDALDLHLEQGEHLTEITCSDVIEYHPVVTAAWTAVSGTATLTVTPTGDATPWGEYPSLGELQITDIVLQSAEGGEDLPLESFAISSGIGWLPG